MHAQVKVLAGWRLRGNVPNTGCIARQGVCTAHLVLSPACCWPAEAYHSWLGVGHQQRCCVRPGASSVLPLLWCAVAVWSGAASWLQRAARSATRSGGSPSGEWQRRSRRSMGKTQSQLSTCIGIGVLCCVSRFSHFCHCSSSERLHPNQVANSSIIPHHHPRLPQPPSATAVAVVAP